MTEQEQRTGEERVILVHGTFANRAEDAGDSWWQDTSQFAEAIQASECGGESSVTIRKDDSFHWSGRNSERARRRAGRKLYRRCRALERDESVNGYHLVGHSHGGSVIWHALRGRRALTKLRSVCTIGSPFFHSRPSYFGWMWLPAALAAGLLYLGHDKAQIFVREFTALQQRGDWFSIVGLPLLAAVLMAVALIGGWLFLSAAVATARSLVGGVSRGRMWRRYGPRWFTLVSSQDEAVNALSAVIDSKPPRFTRPAAEPASSVWHRLVQAVVWLYSFLPFLVDLFVWRVVVSNSLGADVPGETIHRVGRLAPDSRIGAWMPASLDADLIDSANSAAADSVATIRERLGAAFADDDLSPEHALQVFADAVAADILIHTAYFNSAAFVGLVRRWLTLRSQDERAEEVGNAGSLDRRPRPARTSESALVFVMSAGSIAAVLLAAIFARGVFESRVYPYTNEYHVERLMAEAPTDEAAQQESLVPLVEWIDAVRRVKGAAAAERVTARVKKELREGGASEGTRLALEVMLGEQSLHEYVEQVDDPESHGTWDVLRDATSCLRTNGQVAAAEEQTWEIVDEERKWDNPAEAALQAAPILFDLLVDGGSSIEDLYDEIAELAERGDTETATNLADKAGRFGMEPFVMDFPDSDDFRDKVGELLRMAVHNATATRGRDGGSALSYAAVSDSFYSSAAGEFLATEDAHSLDIVTGLLARGDWDEAAADASRMKSENPYVDVEALGRVLVHSQTIGGEDRRRLHVALVEAADRATDRRTASLLIVLRCQPPNTPPDSELTDEAVELAGGDAIPDSEVDVDLVRFWIVERMLREQRGPRAVELLKDWYDASPAELQAPLKTAARLAAGGRARMAAEVLLHCVDRSPPDPTSWEDLFSVSTDPTGGSRAFGDVWSGRPEGLLNLSRRNELEFAIRRCADLFPNVDDLLAAAEQFSDLDHRARVLATLGEALAKRPDDAVLVWQRLDTIAARLDRNSSPSAREHFGRAAVGLARVGQISASERLLAQLDATDRLWTSAYLLRHYGGRASDDDSPTPNGFDRPGMAGP